MKKISAFVANFNELTTSLINGKEYSNYLGLQSYANLNQMARYRKFGRFGILPLAQRGKSSIGGIYGLKIVPNLPFKEWPLVLLLEYDTCYTLAPNFKYLPSLAVARYSNSRKVYDYLNKELKSFQQVVRTVFNFFNSEDDLDLLLTHFSDTSCRPGASSRDSSSINIYLKLLSKINPCPAHLKFRKEVELFRKDDSYLPNSIRKDDFGIWYANLVNKAAMRLLKLKEKDNNLLWNSLLTIHGEDASMRNVKISHNIDEMSTSRFSLNKVARKLEITKDISEHPLHITIKPLGMHNTNYTGAEHLIAAAVLDEEHKDPLAAFNALVSGAYWAGHNMKKALPKIHNQMLNLCKREGWTDAEFALSMMI